MFKVRLVQLSKSLQKIRISFVWCDRHVHKTCVNGLSISTIISHNAAKVDHDNITLKRVHSSRALYLFISLDL